MFTSRLNHRFNPPRATHMERVQRSPLVPRQEEIKKDLQDTLLLVNGILLFLAGLLSYILAGITLNPIKKAYENQRQFLSDASHELRTPLAILQTNLENEITQEKNESEKQRKVSHLEEVHRMTQIVSDLLTLSRLNRDQWTEKQVDLINVHNITKSVVDRLTSVARAQEVKLTINDAGKDKIEVKANEEILVRAITNVVKNAIYYNKKDGEVTVGVEKTDGNVKIVVADTGVGIKDEELNKIFDRFYRIEKSRSRQYGGSGLGLAIVRSSMNEIGGSISIESEPEKGTTVTLTLPIHKSS